MTFQLFDMSWYFSLTISHLTCFFNICAHLNHSLILEVAKFKCYVFLFTKHGINLIILLNAQLLLGDPPLKPKNQFTFNERNDIFFCMLAKWERNERGKNSLYYMLNCLSVGTSHVWGGYGSWFTLSYLVNLTFRFICAFKIMELK